MYPALVCTGVCEIVHISQTCNVCTSLLPVSQLHSQGGGGEGIAHEGDWILVSPGATVPFGIWRKEWDVHNVFTQEGGGFAAVGTVEASLTIGSSGRFIQRYRQVMWVYLTRAWSLLMLTRTGMPSLPHTRTHTHTRAHTGMFTDIHKCTPPPHTHTNTHTHTQCSVCVARAFRDFSYLPSWGLINLSPHTRSYNNYIVTDNPSVSMVFL